MAGHVHRSASAVDGQARQGLQAAARLRRLLARRSEEPAAAAHLRHGLRRRQAVEGLSAPARRGGEARSPSPGPRDGIVPSAGRGGGCHLLAPQGLAALSQARELSAPAPRQGGLPGGEDAADPGPELVGTLRTLGEVPRGDVRGAGRRRQDPRGQADELPRPYPDLQAGPEELSRPALAFLGIRLLPSQ